jgi:hypothetical protein
MARLGYPRYGAQGGDWGTSISTSLTQQDPDHAVGIHLNPPIAAPDPATFDDLTERERESLAALAHAKDWESGYAGQMSTRPQTVAYGLVDSPAALCAWIVEKFRAWTDCDGHPENALTRDEMLDDITLYWLTGTGASRAAVLGEFPPGVRVVRSGRRRPGVGAHRLFHLPQGDAAPITTLGRAAVHRYPALERARPRRALRRLRAAGAFRRRGAGVLPAGPVRPGHP